ncbi:Cold-regulated protein 27 [Linum perenne]
MDTEWTNEKHRLYLKSMESSFVDQLYGYIDLLAQPPPTDSSDTKLVHQPPQSENNATSSGQKVNFQRPVPRVDSRTESRGFLKSPWIQHYRCVRKSQSPPAHPEDTAAYIPSTDLSEKMVTNPQHSQKHHSSSYRHDQDNNYAEVSDQNFVDDDEDEGAKAASTCSSKRMKVVMTTIPHSDQLVPFGNSSSSIDSADQMCISASR